MPTQADGLHRNKVSLQPALCSRSWKTRASPQPPGAAVLIQAITAM